MTTETVSHEPATATKAAWTRRPIVSALIAAAVGFIVGIAPTAIASWTAPPPSSATVFPSQLGTYSWFTLHGDPGAPVTMTYQNGVGVELMDAPQAVALGVDGSTYRRVAAAEHRSIPADQGDPADMVLSADGTFAVIAGANGHGTVVVHSFVDGASRDISIGAGRSAVPLSIASDGDRVLVLLGDDEMSRYADMAMNLHGTLALLDLASGDLADYALDGVTAAAISPDGSHIAAQTEGGAVVMDAAGDGIRSLSSLSGGEALADDAWSPGGTHLATLAYEEEWVTDERGRSLEMHAMLQITDVATDTTAVIPLEGIDHAAVRGWRDDDTVVVQAYRSDNSSEFMWVDAGTGATETFATYDSGFTGASVSSADLARDLVGEWVIEERAPQQGRVVGILIGAVVGTVAGLAVWVIARRSGANRTEA